jgi:predicted Zn finger-like uncharacterized protein
MFKVECPGCSAPYQVDERRVPSSGLKMRCPKCGASFQVDAPDDVQQPPADAARAAAPPKSKLAKQTMLGVAPGIGGLKAPPPAPEADPYADADLPVVGGHAPATGDLRATAPLGSLGAKASPADPNATVPLGSLESPGEGFEDLSDLSLDLPVPAAKPPPNTPPRHGPPRAVPPPRPRPIPPPPSALRPPVATPQPVPTQLEQPEPESPQYEDPFADLAEEVGLPAPARPAPAQPAPPPAPSAKLPSASSDSSNTFTFGDANDDFGELDLPTVPGAPAESDIGLPARSTPAAGAAGAQRLAAATAATAIGFDLELPSPRADLPSPSAGQRTLEQFDLPSPVGGYDPDVGSEFDLPSPAAAALPALGGVELPSLAADLPSPGAPAERSGATAGALPNDASVLPDVDGLELDIGSAAPKDSTTTAVGLGGGIAGAASGAAFGDGLALSDFGMLATDPPPAPAASAPSLQAQAPGADAFGELALDDGGGGGGAGASIALAPSLPPPPAPESAPALKVAAAVPAGAAALAVAATAKAAPRPRKLAKRVALSVLVGCFLVGASLSLVPDVGVFGSHLLLDRLNAEAHQRLIEDTAQAARKILAQDTFPDSQRAVSVVESARLQAPRVRALPAYQAFVSYLRQLRYGSDPESRARGKVLLEELAQSGSLVHLELGRAAQAAAEGELAKARQLLQVQARNDARNIDVLVARGELELKAREPEAALEAWAAAEKIEQSARTAFGMARSAYAAHQTAQALELARRVLERNAAHVGARILMARLVWENSDEALALKVLGEVTTQKSTASPNELVEAHTLLGDVHLSRARISQAEAAYTEALRIDPKASRALSGIGDTLHRAGRFTEAMARFEAAVQADPDDLNAKLGAAKTRLALEQFAEALALLDKLRQSHPKSMAVALWTARVQDALARRDQAEAAYRQAMELGATQPGVIDAYVGLAMLLNRLGRTGEGQEILAGARAKLPDAPILRKAMGELELAQGRYAEATVEYEAALKLDPKDTEARFGLGTALRRSRDFERALQTLEEVAAVDREHPGLALERGLLYEETGRSDEALKEYEAALTKAPSDPDLMLRVGCAKAVAGRGQEAQELLRRVLTMRSTSAETHYCLGRALFVEGKGLGEALRMLERAVELDGNRAEYHLYVGWVANEAGLVTKADESLARAIAIDKGLADAYWQRGVLRARQGAVKDAVIDLRKALELRPSRFEVHAALADAYLDTGQEALALDHFRQAVTANPGNASWQFRYGRLLVANGHDALARQPLAKAVELGEQASPRPLWLWEAHHMMARALGSQPQAIQHWEQFLRTGPIDSPYRSEAIRELKRLGRPWSGT